jgi:RNA polymerase sigma factor (sigma-70 family)
VPDIEDDRGRRERRFCSLYQEHYRGIQAYAVRRVESQSEVADVVAEVFTIAWRRLGKVPAPPADRLWLYGVARRVVAGRHRSARRRSQLAARLAASHGVSGWPGMQAQDPAGDPALRAGRGADLERVAAVFGCLRPAEREALALVLWEELSHAEAARVLGCSVNAVAIRVHRAKARLRAALTGTAATPASAETLTSSEALTNSDQPGSQARHVSAAAKPNRS